MATSHPIGPGALPLVVPGQPSGPAPTTDPAELRLCPECGESLENRSLEMHANLHWPDVVALNQVQFEKQHALAKRLRQAVFDGGVTLDQFRAIKDSGEWSD